MQFSVDPRTNSIIAAGSARRPGRRRSDSAAARPGRHPRAQSPPSTGSTTPSPQTSPMHSTSGCKPSGRPRRKRPSTISPFEQIEREVIIVPEAGDEQPDRQRHAAVLRRSDRRRHPRARRAAADGAHPGAHRRSAAQRHRPIRRRAWPAGFAAVRPLAARADEFTTTHDTTQTSTDQGHRHHDHADTIINAPAMPGFNFNNQPLGNNLSTAALATASQVAAQGLSNFSLNRVNTTSASAASCSRLRATA